MKEQQNRVTLKQSESYTVTRWIDDHFAEVATMSLAEISDAVFKATGINATKSNVRGICRAHKFKFARARTNHVSQDRLSPSKQTRFLAAQLRRVALQVSSLYSSLGVELPVNAAHINFDGLNCLAYGKSPVSARTDPQQESGT